TSGDGNYIAVQPEQISRVVPGLDRNQPLVVCAIGGAHSCGAVISVKMIRVNPFGKRLDLPPEASRPRDMSRVLAVIVPLRKDVGIPLIPPRVERRRARPYARRRAVDVEQENR